MKNENDKYQDPTSAKKTEDATTMKTKSLTKSKTGVGKGEDKLHTITNTARTSSTNKEERNDRNENEIKNRVCLHKQRHLMIRRPLNRTENQFAGAEILEQNRTDAKQIAEQNRFLFNKSVRERIFVH